jgi:hypothetical protein
VASYLLVAWFVTLTSLARAYWVAMAAVTVLAVAATRLRAPLALARVVLLLLVVAALTMASPAGYERVAQAFGHAWRRAATTDVAQSLTSRPLASRHSGVDQRGPIITESLQIRLFEATSALRQLADGCGPAAYVLGCGAGAFLPDPERRITRHHFEGGGRQHNVHVTPVNVLFRTGALGLAVFTGFLAAVFVVLCRVDGRAGPGAGPVLQAYRIVLPVSVMLSFTRFDFVGELSWALQFAWLGWLAGRTRGPAS